MKRLHDLDLSGWNYVWIIVVSIVTNVLGNMGLGRAIVGGLMSLAIGCWLMLKRSSPGTNEYGVPPA